MQNCGGYQSYCVPEPETLLGVARPQGAKQHRAHRHQEDQHRRVVEVYVIPKQKKFIYSSTISRYLEYDSVNICRKVGIIKGISGSMVEKDFLWA